MPKKRIPVILDTDIGGDIDDTWALAMLLKSPELDLKMVVTDQGDTVYRAKVVAKMLEVAGRTDVPIGIGLRQKSRVKTQAEWVKGYRLAEYPGTIHEDGVKAMCSMLMKSTEPMTLICIGPVPNIAAALKHKPAIAARTHFVGMHGSVQRAHRGKKGAIAEWNVRCDPASAMATLSAPWRSATITPLDTCGMIRLSGRRYQKIRKSQDVVLKALMHNYEIWCKRGVEFDPRKESSILFDTVAVYLAFTTRRLKMKKMGVRVTDEGFTIPEKGAPALNVALDWNDYPGYLDFLVDRLLQATV